MPEDPPESNEPLELDTEDPNERAQLFQLCQRELRQMAEKIAADEVGRTLQPTALIHETFLKLYRSRTRSWNDRAHFLRFAARTMRSILVDHKKRRRRQRHGGNCSHEPLDEALHALEARCGGDVCAVHDALALLAAEDALLADYVTLRFFGGLTNAEVSKVLGIGSRTGERHWTFARRWLQGRLER
jgi:RNA polymerase sigma factor (TIGR02999 family)